MKARKRGGSDPREVTLSHIPESPARFIIKGGRVLRGEMEPSGAKNSALPIMFSTILCQGESEFFRVPDLRDIHTARRLLEHFGIEVRLEGGRALIKNMGLKDLKAPYELVRTMRASILALGPLLTRYGMAKVSMPGGCAIGVRPVDLHLKGLSLMGADIEIKHGYIVGKTGGLKGARILLDFPTVTGTENLMMAAVLARGTTVIENAAREPEVADLARALTGMGARIEGAGAKRIEVEGVEELRPSRYTVMPDRIEAGTFCVAAGITGGEILLKGPFEGLMETLLIRLEEAGMEVSFEEGGVRLKGGERILPVRIETLPFPGFPTDMQAQMMALLSLGRGESIVTENIFENRFMHVPELRRMGADIHLQGKTAIVRGVPSLTGATVMATDLRASASLIIAGLAAEGYTEVVRVYHIDRGYERIENKLTALGADIERVGAAR